MKGRIWDACTLETVIVLTIEDPRDQAFWRAGVLWTQVKLAVSQDAFSPARAVIFPPRACAIVFLESKCGVDLHSLLNSVCWLQTAISPAEITVVIDFVI